MQLQLAVADQLSCIERGRTFSQVEVYQGGDIGVVALPQPLEQVQMLSRVILLPVGTGQPHEVLGRNVEVTIHLQPLSMMVDS